MSRLGAAVHIVTTAGTGGKTGFTATAVCSVSDTPATLLVCLNRRSQSGPVLAQNSVFCVNTLPASEEKLADMFAGRSGAQLHERFAQGEWTTLKTGAPVLDVRGRRLRLPHHGDQGGRVAQRDFRLGRSGAAWPDRAGVGLSRARL